VLCLGVMAVRVPTAMSDEHKAALAVGRSESRAVRAYLDALDTNRPKRGRKRTSDTVRRRLDAIETDLVDAAPLTRLQLAQERMDLHDELAAMGEGSNLAELEARFVETAAGYATRKHISYQAWRELGVPAAVLKRAGITRST